MFANNIAVQRNDMANNNIVCFANQGAHRPETNHRRIFKCQVLDRGTLGIPEHAHKVAGGFAYYQILDGMALAIELSVEYMHAIADGLELLARGIDVLRQHVIRGMQVRALTYRLEIFVVLDLERASRSAGTLHGSVCGECNKGNCQEKNKCGEGALEFHNYSYLIPQ